MPISKTWAALAVLLAVAVAVHAGATKTKENAHQANLSYSEDDGEIGGQQVYVDVSINPTWPPSDRKSISYSGYACTIAFCDWGFCYCDYPYAVQFSGYGEFPAEAFTIAPQGRATLALDTADVTGGYAEGACDRIDVEWNPSGEFHISQHGQFAVSSPTEITRGVSHEDEWHALAAGNVCGIGVQPPASGYVHRNDFLNVVRELK